MKKLHTSYSNIILWAIKQDDNSLRIYCSLRSLVLMLSVWWIALLLGCIFFIWIANKHNEQWFGTFVIVLCVLTGMFQAAMVVPRYFIDKSKGDYLAIDLAAKSVRLPHLKKEFPLYGQKPTFRFDFYKDQTEGYSEFNIETADGQIYPILKLLAYGYRFGKVDKKLQKLGFDVKEYRHKID